MAGGIGLSLLLAAVLQFVTTTEELDVNITHAFNRQLAAGWQPYLVTMTNRGERNLDLAIEVSHLQSSLVVTRRVALSPDARQSFFIYLYTPWRQYEAFNCRVVDSDGNVIKRPSISTDGVRYGRSQASMLILSKAGDTTQLLGMQNTVSRWGGSIERFVCTAERFPDRAVGLRGIGMIVLHDTPLEALSPAQRRALLDYVVQGGRLVIVPGVDRGWLEDPVIQGIVPFTVTGAETRTHLPALRSSMSASLDSDSGFVVFELEGGTPHVMAGPTPLVVRFRRGLGTVMVVTTDLNRPAVSGWSGSRGLWQQVLADTASVRTAGLPLSEENIDEKLLSWISSNLRRTPPVLLILLLTVVYALVMGPLHLLFIRRMKRPLLAIVSIPTVAVAFLGVVTLSGVILRGNATIGQQLNLMTSFSGDSVALERVVFSLHAGSDRTFDIQAPEALWLSPRGIESWSRQDTQGYGIRMEQGAATFISDLPIAKWQTRFFSGERAVAVGGGIRFTLDDEHVTVSNASGVNIRSAMALLSGRDAMTLPIGAVAAGGEAVVGLERAIPELDPVAGLEVDEKSIVGRVLSEWAKRQPWKRVGFDPLLICVMDREPGAVATDVGRRESAVLWVVYSKKAAGGP